MKKTRLETLQNAVKLAEARLEKSQQVIIQNEKALIEAQQKLDAEVAKASAKEAKTTQNANSPKKKKSRPVGQVALGTLANRLATSLQNTSGTFNVPDVNLRNLQQKANSLLQLNNQSELLVNQKKTNTNSLERVNTEINAAVSRLKTDLRALHGKTNIDTIYSNYGLTAEYNNNYAMVRDNTLRVDKLNVLISKLQENGNPIQNWPNYNLNAWVDLQQRHNQLWQESENLRALRSGNVSQLTPVYEEVEATVKRIYQYVNYALPKTQAKSKLRELGFLRESF
jgi:hypothetical protein